MLAVSGPHPMSRERLKQGHERLDGLLPDRCPSNTPMPAARSTVGGDEDQIVLARFRDVVEAVVDQVAVRVYHRDAAARLYRARR